MDHLLLMRRILNIKTFLLYIYDAAYEKKGE